MKVRYIKPHHGHVVGDVVEPFNLGVAKTLIQMGICEEVKTNAKKLDDSKTVSTGKSRSKPRRSKKPTKTSDS